MHDQCICLLCALAFTIVNVPRAMSESWDPRTPLKLPSNFRSDQLIATSKITLDLARCVQLLESKQKLQALKHFCLGMWAWDPGERFQCARFIDDLVSSVERTQENGHKSSFRIRIAHICLTLLVNPPSSHPNDLPGQILGPKMKRRVGGSRGGLSFWIVVIAFLGGSLVFGLFFWLVLKCYRGLLATWG